MSLPATLARAGWPEDVARLGRRELQDFFTTHYTPQRLTIAIVGDVSPTKVQLPTPLWLLCSWDVKACM